LNVKPTQIFALLSFSIGLSNAQVWVVDSLQRVGKSDAPGSALNIALYAAKGESESFQVIVRAPASGLSVVNLTASGLSGPSGATIAAANFIFYREHYVYISKSSPDFGVGNRPLGIGWYPDALIPFKNPKTGVNLSGATYDAVPYAVAANQNQPFWIDIAVPRGAVAGDYTGTLTVTTSTGSTTVGVKLRVWNFTLPVASRHKSSFGFHGGWNTLANNQVLLENRIQPFNVDPQDFPTVAAQMRMAGLPFFNQSKGCTIETPPSVSTVSAAVKSYPAGFPTYVYPADEVSGCPNLVPNLQAWAQVAHGAGTKTLVTVPPDPSLLDDGTGSGRSAVDIWAILPKQMCVSSISLLPCIAKPAIPIVLAKGNEIWSYTEQEQDYYSPKWLLDFAPINYRIMPGFINQQFGFTGMLYSDVARWSTTPWTSVQWTNSVNGLTFPGDGVLVYPGQQVGLSFVVPSMRLKLIRDGVDDFDYIAMLKDLGQGSFVNTVLSSIVPDWHNWTKSTATLQSARIELGQELDKLGAGTVTLKPPSNPWPTTGTTSPATSLTLQCSSVSGATQYQVYFGKSSTALPLYATVTSTGSVVRAAVYKLSGATTYYWKVVAVNGGSSASGPVWSFKTP